MKRILKTIVVSITTLSTFSMFAGCVSPERKPAVAAVTSLADTRTELVAGKANIDEVVAAIAELEARPANLTPPYDKYKSAVESIRHRAEAVADRVRDMRMRSAEYRAKWSQENAQIGDASLRASADDRRQRVADRYDAIDRDAQDLRAAYDPFVKKLHDVQTVLANDLTYNGVASAKPAFDDLRSSATALRGKVDALIAELDDASMRLSPSTQSTR